MADMNLIDRRRLLQAMAFGACGMSVSGWLPALAEQLATDPRRRRHCILLWMAGGPSQMDTWDMKPGHENGGEFKEIATKVPGVRFSEHMPKLAQQADKLAIIRSLETKEGDHERGTYLMRTGRRPMSVIDYPSVGAALAKQIAAENDSLPGYVSIAPTRGFGRGGFGPGFLGPKYCAARCGRRRWNGWREAGGCGLRISRADGRCDQAAERSFGRTSRASVGIVEGVGRRFSQQSCERVAQCPSHGL